MADFKRQELLALYFLLHDLNAMAVELGVQLQSRAKTSR